MDQANRPLSPHLQIYRPQMTSVLSIFHRMSGAGLWLGTVVLTYWLYATALGPEQYDLAQAIFGSWIGMLALLGWSFALFYHLCNGIRHLFWDASYGYDLDTAARSGWGVMLATLVLTVIAWGIGLSAGGGS